MSGVIGYLSVLSVEILEHLTVVGCMMSLFRPLGMRSPTSVSILRASNDPDRNANEQVTTRLSAWSTPRDPVSPQPLTSPSDALLFPTSL
jgi:hypothetical protein